MVLISEKLSHSPAAALLFLPALIGTARWPAKWTGRAAPKYLDELLDVPSRVEHYAVHVQYMAGTYEYGSDTGVVCFSEGWMHFQGMRTTWSIQRWHVRASPYDTLELGREARLLSVKLHPYDAFGTSKSGLRLRFHAELEKWYGRQPEFAPAVWPPLQPPPEFGRENARLCRFLALVARLSVAVLLAGILVLALVHSDVLGSALVAAGLMGLFVARALQVTSRDTVRAIRKNCEVGSLEGEAETLPIPVRGVQAVRRVY